MLQNTMHIYGEVVFGSEDQPHRKFDELHRKAVSTGLCTDVLSVGHAKFGQIRLNSAALKRSELEKCSPIAAILAGEIFNLGDLVLELTGNRDAITNANAFVAQAYEAWDGKCLSRINGTFAAAIWDNPKRQLILCCDRRADARLYYHSDNAGIIFSSSLDLISKFTGAIDVQAVREFLRFLYIAPPRTIYDGVSRVEPGQYVVVSNGQVITKSLPEFLPSWQTSHLSTESPEAVSEMFENLALESARRRLSNRRVGLLMSSGVDSATLAALCKTFSCSLEAYTVSFNDRELDEAERARALGQQLGLAHDVLRFSIADYQNAFERMCSGFDQPVADPASLPLTLACAASAGQVDVISDGTGADGLFSAHVPRHISAALGIALRTPVALRQAVSAKLKGGNSFATRKVLPFFDFDDPEELLITWSGWKKAEINTLFDDEINFSDSAFYRAFRGAEPGGSQAIYDAVAVYPSDDCRIEAAALAQLPIYFPYHDPEFEGFVRSLPQGYRFRGGQTKLLLRDLYRKYFPESLWDVSKRYFTFPLQSFMADGDYALVRRNLSPEIISRIGIVDDGRVRPWIDRYLSGEDSLKFKIWALLVLHGWLLHHLPKAQSQAL